MDRSEQPRPNPPGKLSSIERLGSRLDSWKEIASYLGRSEKTVRRWEDREELPVHRLIHEKRGSVYAYTSELDAWREMRKTAIESEPMPGDSGAKIHRHEIHAARLEGAEKIHLPAPRRLPPLIYIVTTAGLSLAVLLAGMYWGRLRDLVASGPNTVRIQSLAVLPLENLSKDNAEGYFADGITDELIGDLGKISALRVISEPLSCDTEERGNRHKRLPETLM
ncbi:MAG: hypothetical protein ACR2IV_16740 [Bryobacteraceae bacterium]